MNGKTLHSTMSLLKPVVPFPCNNQYDNALHSTMSLLKPGLTADAFNNMANFTFHYVAIKTDSKADRRTFPSNFTFHYVAIKTVPDVAFETLENSFTFHYVAIKTLYGCFGLLRLLPLHSTMSLLKPPYAYIS